MRSQTMVFGASTRRTESWRVYQIRTANSLYELEVQEAGAPRRCAVLTKLGPSGEALQTFEDSQPRLGDRCLYDVSPLDWMGQALAVGTACTSPVQSVEFVKETSFRAPRGSATLVFSSPPSQPVAAPAPRSEAPAPARAAEPAPPPWAPFPLGCVEMLEAAASVMGAVCHRHDLEAALARDPKLARRYRLALAQCGVMLETLTGRQDGGS
jgi:hypothetical protein